MPMPTPPVGGMPYISALMKSSSIGIASSSPAARSCLLLDEARELVQRVVQLGEGVADLAAADVRLEPLDVASDRPASASPAARARPDNRSGRSAGSDSAARTA